MSDVDRSVLVGFENHLALLPHEIGEDPRFDVRLYTSDGEKAREDKRIAFLAQSIERDGQLDDCLIVPAEGGKAEGNGHHPKYIMVAGHRRRKAVTLLNDRKTSQGQPLLRLRCRVLDPQDAVVRKCAASNIQRTDLSPMHKARLFERTRKEEGWGEGPKADKKVAEFFGVSLATVTQHNKFLSAPPKIQEALAAGEISADTAFELLAGVKPENVEKVMEQSRVEQIRSAADKAMDDVATGKKTPEEARKVIEQASTGRIEAPAARKAIRNQPEEEKQGPTPLTKKEILEEIESIDGPAYGAENSAVRKWARYAVDKWATGVGTTKGMLRLFDAMVQGAEKPSLPEKDDKGKAGAEKASTGKASTPATDKTAAASAAVGKGGAKPTKQPKPAPQGEKAKPKSSKSSKSGKSDKPANPKKP